MDRFWDDSSNEPDDLFECDECGDTFPTGGIACCGQPVTPNPDYNTEES